MENPPVSPIEVLNAAIQSHNPFINAGIVKEQDVWGKKFTDVPTLNSHASDAVFQAIKQVRTSQSSQDKVTSIAITAQQGVGKTHLLSRIRHRLEREGGALFVYAGVNNYTDLNLVKYQFQQTLADSLSHTASQEVMQWQEVAAAIANEGFKAINPNAPNLSPQELIQRFDKVSASWGAKNKSLMNVLTKQVLKTKQNADPYIIRAILWTLSETQSSFAIKWLSGDELAQSNAEVLGLPNPSKTSQDREAEALKNVQQTLNLVSYYNPVVICFDEIDVKNNSTDDGLPTELVIADLVKRLHDTLENSELSKGVVILTVMLPDTWTQKVNLMPGGTPDRVSKYTQRKPIDLKYISGNSMVELVTLWLKYFYESRNLFPPNSCYPKEYEIFDLTRGCLVRSQSKIEQTKKNSEAYKLLDQLILEKGGEHVPLIEEQIRPLIAVHSVYQKRGNYDLTEEQVFDFISQQQLTFENPLLADILSDPSGRMPAVDERDSMELLEDFLNPSNINETDDSDDLGELFN